ncbi:MAG TPA: PEP-CTERM sorting domain-containing protein [Chthoniobacteraceae bacterium]|nr:PEP-CTERM sorting domain-containing protein [Chthoniobacteraceae bacterium]
MKKTPCYLLLLLLVQGTMLHADDFYYDLTGNPGWLGSNAWSLTESDPVYNQSWADITTGNDTARFSTTLTNHSINVGGGVVNLGSGGIYRTAPGSDDVLRISAGGTDSTLRFNGGTVRAGSSNGQVVQIYSNGTSKVKLEGNFTVSQGTFLLTAADGITNAYEGTATIGTSTTAGQLAFNGSGTVSNQTHLLIQQGIVRAGWGNGMGTGFNFGTLALNAPTLAGGTFQIGANSGTEGLNVSVTSLSGTLGQINLINAANNTTITSSLTVNQAGDTVYSGTIAGVATGATNRVHYLSFTKSGEGILRLQTGTTNNTINLRAGTTVNAGTLLINGTGTRNFENVNGENAITVNAGGTFGGTSALTLHGGDHLRVEDGGFLSPGDGDGVAGRTSLTFTGEDGALDLSNVTTATGWLKFDLGADTTAGTTYDQIRLTDGIFNIGTGLLEFDDFSFQLLAGFGEGTYRLVELAGESSLQGTLGSQTVGLINANFVGTLYFDESDHLMLEVAAVPEPSALLLSAGAGLGMLHLLRRRRA